jgi:hypothetical protein
MFIIHPIKYTQHLRHLCQGLFLLVASSLLLACGGGSGGSDSASPTVPDTPITTPPPLIAPGAYVATVSGKEWVAMLLPTTQGSGGITSFYGLYYNATDPDLYSGSGAFTGTNIASLPRVFLYPNISAAIRTGSGTVSNLGNGVIRASLSFPANGLEQGKDLNIAASAPSNYLYNTPAKLSQVQGPWLGRWSYGMGYVDSFSLNISSQGAVSTSMVFQQDCQLTQGALSPNFDGTNLFTFSLTLPNATQCSLKGQVLNGAAFVTVSPVAGKTQRLYIVGVTTDGRGISFRADR